MNWLTAAPRRVLALISVACVAMLAFGMYLQHVVGLEPCPMCIVQRYALIAVAVFAGLASARGQKGWWMTFGVLAVVAAGFGAFVAARQSWLQWYPPEIATCGRDCLAAAGAAGTWPQGWAAQRFRLFDGLMPLLHRLS